MEVSQKQQRIYVGDTVRFICKVKEGIPKPTVFWKSSNGYRVPDNHIKDQHDGGVILLFRNVNKQVQGNYSCVALNVAGNDEETVTLNVKGDIRTIEFLFMCYKVLLYEILI